MKKEFYAEKFYAENTENACSQYFLNGVKQKIWKLVFSSICIISMPTQAELLGTELSLRTLAQATSTSTPVITSFERYVIVDELVVEFPDVESLFNPSTESIPGFARSLVDVAIDVGDNFIEIDFANSAPSTRFASGFENTYVFKFDSLATVNIVGAEIDTSVTTLGLEPSDISFRGNELFVNVESLTFTPETFVRINLLVENAPTECSSESSIIGTVSPNLDIHMPSLNYQSLGGIQNLWADFEYYGQSENGELLWKLKEYGVNQ